MKIKSKLNPLFYRYGYEPTYRGITRIDHLWAIREGLNGHEAEVVFDIGANRGQTLSYYYPFFRQARIYCFEPDPEPFDCLRQIARPMQRASIFNMAFGAFNEEKTLYVNQASEGNSLLEVAAGMVEPAGWLAKKGEKQVLVCTLDKFCYDNAVQQIDLLKMDTQGYEANILSGATGMLSRQAIKAIFAEVLFKEYYQEQAYFEDVYSILKSYGYRLVDLYQKSRGPDGALAHADALFLR